MSVSPGDPEALARGLLLGDDQYFSPEMVKLFREAGVTHLVAASGANLGLVGWLITPWTRLWPRRMGLIWLALALFAYWRLSGGSGSLWRSLGFALAVLMALLWGRRFNHWLLLAIVLLVGWRFSEYSRTLGFWLSSAAMLGVLLSRKILPSENESPLLAQWRGVLYRPLILARESVLIFLCVAPLLWYSFGQISFSGALITPMVGWLVFPYQFTALIFFGFNRFFKPLAGLLATCLTLEYRLFIGIIRISLKIFQSHSTAFSSVLLFLLFLPLSLRVLLRVFVTTGRLEGRRRSLL